MYNIFLIMIWGLKLCILYKKTVDMSLRSSIHTGTVFFARKLSRTFRSEPGLRNLKKIEEPNTKFSQESDDEHDLDDDFDFTKMNEAYDLHQWQVICLGREQKKEKSRTQLKIISKKYFAPRPQPPMLTWNERQYIKYLHNEDPIQWNLKCLSESFPATPDTIKKILKSKMKMSPERAKSLDLKVQKNWELLAEGKLDADPHVLEHFKKFSNKKEVLLEQVKNMKFYLPEIKKEPVWNHGEMNQILVYYDKAINKLRAQAEENQNSKALSSGVSEQKSLTKKEKSNLDLINEGVEMQIKNRPELKDSFIYGKVIDAFKENITLEELKNKLLQKTEKKEKLDITEKAILDSVLAINNSENLNKNKNINHNVEKSLTTNEKGKNMKKNLDSENKICIKFDKKYVDSSIITTKMKSNTSVSFNNETRLTNETGISKLLTDISVREAEVTETKPKPDISDSVKLQNEKAYYDQEVSGIKNTAFWGNNMRSREKEMLEFEKCSLEVPKYSDEKMSKTSPLNYTYPQRIKIPRNKWRSGLTFRVKDCYYDDDGEFLYRVPGMTK